MEESPEPAPGLPGAGETECYVTTETCRQHSYRAYMNALALRRAHSANDVPRCPVMRSNQGETGR